MAEAEEEEVQAGPEHCYHCGRPTDTTNLSEDWFCPHCERYQMSVACPTCHQVADRRVMETGAVPAPAKAKRA